MVMAGSGMCTGGRIKHHLVANIERPESTLLFVGYQSPDTLGGYLVTRPTEVRIHGKKRTIRAKIEQIHGLSAHADRSQMLDWLGALNQPPKQVFLCHGEERAALAFADRIRERYGWPVTVPEYQDTVELSD